MQDETHLFELFKLWLNGPDADLGRDMPAEMGALESGLWAAYRAGYERAARDSEAARRLVQALASLPGH